MKKIAVVFIISFFWLFLQEISAGGVRMDFESLNSNPEAKDFAKKFKSEMEKRKNITDQFAEDYLVIAYIGAAHSQKTGRRESAIGIFINDPKEPVFIIWFDELFSREEIKKKAKEVADSTFEYLKKLDNKKKETIKVLV